MPAASAADSANAHPVLRPGQVVVLDNLPAHKYPENAHGWFTHRGYRPI